MELWAAITTGHTVALISDEPAVLRPSANGLNVMPSEVMRWLLRTDHRFARDARIALCSVRSSLQIDASARLLVSSSGRMAIS